MCMCVCVYVYVCVLCVYACVCVFGYKRFGYKSAKGSVTKAQKAQKVRLQKVYWNAADNG